MIRRSTVLLALLLAAPALADSAAEVWTARCKSCHGDDGRAKTKVGRRERIPDFTKPEWQEHHDDTLVRNTIRNGSPDNRVMKGYKDRLSNEEVESLVTFIRAMKGK